MTPLDSFVIMTYAFVVILGPFIAVPFLFWLAGRFERKHPSLGGMFTASLWAGILALFVGLLHATYVPALRLPDYVLLADMLEHDGYTERGWPFAWWGVRWLDYMFIPGKMFLNILIVAASCLLFCGLFALLLRLIKDEVSPGLRNPLVFLLFGLMPLWWPNLQRLVESFFR